MKIAPGTHPGASGCLCPQQHPRGSMRRRRRRVHGPSGRGPGVGGEPPGRALEREPFAPRVTEVALV
eukprot:12936969-Prorocentrum_lima.AAC.1